MSKLECHVSTCQHHSGNLCSLDKIKVDGANARESRDTSCLSFTEKRGMMQNAIYSNQTVTESAGVACSADNCAHNEHDKCCADSVSMDSCTSDVSSKCGTQCNTFCPE